MVVICTGTIELLPPAAATLKHIDAIVACWRPQVGRTRNSGTTARPCEIARSTQMRHVDVQAKDAPGLLVVAEQGVAMVSQLLADGGGPLYCEVRSDDLAHIVGM